MKKVTLLLLSVFALSLFSCSTATENKCEGEGCDSTKVAVDTAVVAEPVAVDTNSAVATDSVVVKAPVK